MRNGEKSIGHGVLLSKNGQAGLTGLYRIAEGDKPTPALTDFDALAARSADPPLPIPETLPARTARSAQPRFSESSVYPYLETNVDDVASKKSLSCLVQHAC